MVSPASKTEDSSRLLKFWPVFLLLCSLEGLLVLARLLSLAPDPKNALLFGFSAIRLSLAGVVLAASLGALYCAVRAWRDPGWQQRWLAPLSTQANKFSPAMAIASVLLSVSWLVLVIVHAQAGDDSAPLYQRLFPLLAWLMLVAGQFLLWLPAARFGLDFHRLNLYKALLLGGLLIWLIFLVLWAIIVISGIGLREDTFGWGRRGVPLLAWQVAIGWLVLLWAQILSLKANRPPSGRKLDWILGAIIWAAAVLLWTVKLPGVIGYPTHFGATPSRDTALYEMAARSILNGNGFLSGEIVPRPLFLLGLAGLHLLAGNSYDLMAFFQILILAFIPVVLYFLGKALSGRPMGLMIALLVILREFNSILATRYSIVSNSRMMMSDMPATLAICLLTLAAVLWLQAPATRRVYPLLVGGLAGATALVRTQSVIIIPFILFLALLVYHWDLRRWLRDAALLAAAMMLVVFPWLWRNWRVTGALVMDDPATQTSMLAERYTNSTSTLDTAQRPGESAATYSQRLSQSVSRFALANPGFVTGFVSAHYSKNTIDTVLVLPVSASLDDYHDNIVISTAFWHPFAIDLSPGQAILLGLNLLLIALGLAYSWRRWRYAGVLPLVVFLAYNLSNAIARNSGYRFILPVDWVGYFYFCIGAALIVSILMAMLRQRVPSEITVPEKINPKDRSAEKRLPVKAGIITAAIALIVGLASPLAEWVFPQRYPIQDKSGITNALTQMEPVESAGIDPQALLRFSNLPQSIALWGQGLFPSYIQPGQEKRSYPEVSKQDYPQLAFMLVGAGRHEVTMPLRQAPDHFPNASDVIVLGCPQGDDVSALLVAVLGENPVIYLKSSPDNQPLRWECPQE
jgi:hypothetical protein